MTFLVPEYRRLTRKPWGLLAGAGLLAAILAMGGFAGLGSRDARADLIGFTYSSPPTLRVPDLGVTACAGTIEVPILAKNHDPADGAFVVLEFDSSLVGYAWYKEAHPAWQVERAVPYGQERVHFLLHHRDVSGAVRGEVDPGNDVDSGENTDDAYDLEEGESVLFTVVLFLKTACRNDRGFAYRSEITLGNHDAVEHTGDSYFFLDGSGGSHQIVPTVLEDGRFNVYLQDGIELGWGALTKAAQEFSLPLYLTAIDPEQTEFLVGVDYDELFLNVSGVTGRFPALEKEAGPSFEVRAPGKAFFRLRLHPDAKGPLCGAQLANLRFEYNGDLPPAGELVVRARLLREIPSVDSPLGGAGAPANGDPANGDPGFGEVDFGQGGAYGETIPGIVSLLPAYFVRGNVDSSAQMRSDGMALYLPDLLDAQQILNAVFVGNATIGCADAADVNNSGTIEVTDAILILNYLFRGGVQPRGPFPYPGPDPGAGGIQDSLDCDRPVPVFRELPLR